MTMLVGTHVRDLGHGAVVDTPGVWAIGDATTFPLDQAGLASPAPPHTVVRAKLFTGRRPVYLGERATGDDAEVATTHPGPFLDRLDVVRSA